MARPLALGLSLVLAASIVHAPAVGLPFVQEDYYFLARVRHTTPIALLATFLSVEEGWYRPVLTVYFALLHELLGLRPGGFHLVNIGLLTLNAALVALLGRRLGLTWPGQMVAAIVYAGHTAFTTLVLWPAAASSLLVVAASLATLLVLGGPRRPWRVALATATFALALMARENAVVVPALAALVLWPLGRPWVSSPRAATGAAWTSLVHISPLWLLLGLYLLARAGGVARMATETVYAMSLGPHLLTNLAALLVQASGVPLVLAEERSWLMMMPLTIWLGLIVGVLWRWRSDDPVPVVGLLWFAVACAPVLPLAHHAMDSYYLDLPLVGLALSVGVLLPAGLTRVALPGGGAVPAALLLIAYLGLSGLAVRTTLPRSDLVVKAHHAVAVVDRARASYPHLPRGGTLTLTGSDELTYWATGWGAAFQIAYDDPTLRVVFAHRETPPVGGAILPLAPR